ncbi:hypothetical protein ACU4GD_39725 [Cupriavidus basilensis]
MDGGFEQPVWLGGGRLFGILCAPRERLPAGTAVIFPEYRWQPSCRRWQDLRHAVAPARQPGRGCLAARCSLAWR